MSSFAPLVGLSLALENVDAGELSLPMTACRYYESTPRDGRFKPEDVVLISACIDEKLLPPHGDLQMKRVSQGNKEIRLEKMDEISLPPPPGSTSEDAPSRFGSGTER